MLMCVCAFSLCRESLNRILGDKPLLFQGGSVTVTTVASTRKTLDEVWAHEHVAAIAWKKEKTIARHMEQQLTAAQWIATPPLGRR
jgi:hypothetical protein